MAGPRSSIDVFLSLHGQRKFAREVAASGAELEAMGVKGAQAMARFAATGDRLKKFGRSWTHNVTLPVAALGFVAGKMAVDFHQAMSLVQTQAGASAKETKFLEGAVLNFAKNSKFGPTEVADALFRVRSAGFKAKEALDVLKQGMNLSTVGNSDLEMTTKALTGAAKSLHLEKPGQLRGLAAEMNAIVGTGDMRMEELQDALSTGVLPAFVSAGMGIRDYGTALTVMTDRNVPAQVASTRLRTAVSMLVPHTKKAEDALKGVGIQGERLANLMRHQGLPATIEYLASKLDKFSKNKANKVMIEAFGGAKSSATMEMLVENADELGKKWNWIANGVGKYQHQIKVAEEQPGNKLAKAWSSIQVALVQLGDELLPVVVPGFERLANTFGTVAHIFVGLPHNVQAAAVGFLLLTGPIASGLGYFASGIGRALILTRKLATVGRDLSIFSSALQSGQGLTGSASMAFQGSGMQAALQTAKGFAFSLGPAIAAYGIGNIITSATSGDWKDAGFEAGGALAGGVAGFFLSGGNPFGAMLGVGVGSLGGELLSGLFKDGKGIPTLQDRIATSSKGLKKALEGQNTAMSNLHNVQRTFIRDRRRQKSAAESVKGAEHALERVRANAPAGSMAVARAEVRLAQAIEHVTRAKKKAKQAERLKGEARGIAKEELRYAALEERHRKGLLKARIAELRQQRQSIRAHAADGERLAKLKPVNEALIKSMGKLHTVNKQQNETFAKAANEIGPKFAGFLRHASREALNLGSKLKVVAKIQREVNRESEAYIQARREGYPTIGEAEAGRRHPHGPMGKGAPPPRPSHLPGSHLPSAAHSRFNSGTAQSMLLPPPRRIKLEGGSLSQHAGQDLTIQVPVELDGKVITETVAKHSTRAANRS